MDAFTLAAKLTLDSGSFDDSLANIEGSLNSSGSLKKFAAWGTTIGNLASKAFSMAFRASSNFMKDVVKTGMDFDEMMQSVRSVREMTDEEFNAMREKAIELGRTTKFTAEEVAEGFFYEAIAGWDVDKMLQGIGASLNLAAAAGENLGITSDIVTDAMTGFGMKADQTQHFVDVLAAAASNSNTTVSLMGQTFQYLAPVAGTLGYSIDDVAVGIGILANNGVKGSKAGTALRQILSSLIDPSKDAAEAMSALGISITDSDTGRVKSFGEMVANLRQVFKNADFDLAGRSMEELAAAEEKCASRIEAAQQKYDANEMTYKAYTTEVGLAKKELADFTKFNEVFLGQLSDIAGTRGITALMALMKSSDEEFNNLMQSVQNSEGEADRMAAERLNSLKGDITLFNSALDGLKILVSDEYKNDLRSFVTTFTEEIGKMSGAFEEGGLAGMFTNLTDWMINGITNALSNPEITQEGANDFGKALGDFVGHLVSKLVTSAPAIVSGLFEAGMNLAGGLVEGLFSGLFGTGENTVYGMISATEDEQRDAINQANATATQAQGIVSYMDSLVQKYGSAASSTAEWASALERLESVLPGVSQAIKQNGEDASGATANLREYIELSRQQAIEEARKKALATYQQAYDNAKAELDAARVSQITNEAMMKDMVPRLVQAYIQQYENVYGEQSQAQKDYLVSDWMTGLQSGAYSVDDFRRFALSKFSKDNLGPLGLLFNAYDEYAQGKNDSTASIADLTTRVDVLKTQLEVANGAFDTLTGQVSGVSTDGMQGGFDAAASAASDLASRLNSVSVPTFAASGGGRSTFALHAKGAWNIPYDNYPALLHRGERVLTATQARRQDYGESQGASAQEIAQAVRSAIMGFTMELNGETFGRIAGDSTTSRVNRNIASINRRRQYGYGG